MTKKMVYVDDEASICLLIQDIFECEPIELITFDNPVLASRYLATNSVDLVMTDYRMPEITGVSLIKKLELNCPVILVTGELNIENDLTPEDLELFTEIVLKPFSISQVLEICKKHLQG